MSQCDSVEMKFPEDGVASCLEDQAAAFDLNKNGRIFCEEARKQGIAPVERIIRRMPGCWNRDEDGMVCE